MAFSDLLRVPIQNVIRAICTQFYSELMRIQVYWVNPLAPIFHLDYREGKLGLVIPQFEFSGYFSSLHVSKNDVERLKRAVFLVRP